jgi:RNA polymerase sigma factor (sigma-70 family)
VFASAYRELSAPGGAEMRIKPWLYTVARNRCLTILRARRQTVDAELGDLSTAGLAEPVEQRADLRELLADLHDLPEDQRAALVLTELGDLTHEEVGTVLGCEARKVKGLVFRARSGLAERRDARAAPCEEIREELASARRGALRRGRLRHHLSACAGCSSYLDEVRYQRKGIALLLPVIPTLGLKESVLAAAGAGGAAGGGTAAGGGVLAGLAAAGPAATVAKVAVLGALAGSAGVAGGVAIDRSSDGPPPADAPAAPPARGEPRVPAVGSGAPPGRPAQPGERSASDRGALGRERAAARGRKIRRRVRGGRSAVPVKPLKGREPRAPAARGPESRPPAGARPTKPPRPVTEQPPARAPSEPPVGPPRPAPRQGVPLAPAPVEEPLVTKLR